MPEPDQPQLRQLLAATVSSKSHGLDVAKDWRLVKTGLSAHHHSSTGSPTDMAADTPEQYSNLA
jgi:hypothetical protein